MPFAHYRQEAHLKRPNVATGLSERFERDLREGVARTRASHFRRPNWSLIVAMLIFSDALLVGSVAMEAVMGEAARNCLFLAAFVPGIFVVALLYCEGLKLRS